MSSLVVVGFPTVEEAEEVRSELVDIQREQLISLEDAVVVERDAKGQVHLRQALNLTAAGALGGDADRRGTLLQSAEQIGPEAHHAALLQGLNALALQMGAAALAAPQGLVVVAGVLAQGQALLEGLG